MNNRNVFLPGEEINLVLIETDDAATLASFTNNQNVTQYLSRGDSPMTLEAEIEWIQGLYQRPNDITLGIWHKADQKLIGSCGLHRINQRDQHATFGILIGLPEYWGRGLGSDALRTLLDFAFNVKNLRRVILDVLATNQRAIKSYEKCGFTIVGTIPEHIWKNGRWHDLHTMVATRP